jgi:hypothetical protein
LILTQETGIHIPPECSRYGARCLFLFAAGWDMDPERTNMCVQDWGQGKLAKRNKVLNKVKMKGGRGGQRHK